ncbi:MAG: recombinase family protein [Agathobacter sp.]
MQCNVVAMYIRLSAEDDDLDDSKIESNSVANQRMLLTEYIRSKPDLQNCEIIEFCDDGYTGTNFDRPGFQQMMVQVKLKQIGCIIVKDLSRFGREYLDVSSYLELILPIFDIRFISVNDGFDSNDYIGTTGGIELAIRNLLNSMYSKDISMKVKTARKTRERKGEYLGGHPFYGYLRDPVDRHHLIVDEEARPVIEKIFHLSVAECSTMKIAKILNEEGIPCPVELKKSRGIGYSKPLVENQALWTQSTVRKIIRDERYLGKMVSNVRRTAFVGKNIMVNNHRSEWIIVEGTHEAIISQELFDEANLALTSRLKTVNKNTSWKQSGNLFVCGYCGRKLQKSTTKDIYMYCQKGNYTDKAECNGIHEDRKMLQEKVLDVLKTMGTALSDAAVKKVPHPEDAEKNPETILAELQKQLQKMPFEKRQLYEKYRTGEITREKFIETQSQYQEKCESLERQAAVLETEIQEKRREQKEKNKVADELRTISDLNQYDAEIIGQIVEKVLVYDEGRIELVMKCQDAYEQVFREKADMSA